jgi:hypothetical protein
MTKPKSESMPIVVPKPIECICDKPLLDGRVCFKCGRPVKERRAA